MEVQPVKKMKINQQLFFKCDYFRKHEEAEVMEHATYSLSHSYMFVTSLAIEYLA